MDYRSGKSAPTGHIKKGQDKIMEIKCEISVNIDSEQFYRYAIDEYKGSDYYVECGFTTFKTFLTDSTYIRKWLDMRTRTAYYSNDYEMILLNSELCDKVEKALIDYAVRRFEGPISKGKTAPTGHVRKDRTRI